MVSLKCPYCAEVFIDNKLAHTNHVAEHLYAKLKSSYPGLIEKIENVEAEMPIKFMVKIDTVKAIFEENLTQTIVDKLDEDD